MKDFLTRNPRKKLISFVIALAVYVGLQILSMTLLKDVYMFEWMGRNLYCYIWVLSVLLIIFDRTLLSSFVTLGTLIGTILGHFLGSFILKITTSQITSDMDPGKIYNLSCHKGVFIFVITFLVIFIVGVISEIILNIKAKQSDKVE